jgi:hypothetical protein
MTAAAELVVQEQGEEQEAVGKREEYLPARTAAAKTGAATR